MKLIPQQLFEFKCELQERITEREGMMAENQQRSYLGQSLAYSDDEFFILQSKMKAIRSRIVHLGEKPEPPHAQEI